MEKQILEKMIGVQQNMNTIANKIDFLDKQAENDPLMVKKEIDNILNIPQIQEGLKGNLLKIELLKIKAKAISTLGGIDNIDDIFNQILITLNEEYNFSDNKEIDKKEKRKLFIEYSIYKIKLLSENYWRIWNSKGKIILETHKQFEDILLKEVKKLIELGETKQANDILIEFYHFSGQTKKEEILLKENAKSKTFIDSEKYLSLKVNTFLKKYKL